MTRNNTKKSLSHLMSFSSFAYCNVNICQRENINTYRRLLWYLTQRHAQYITCDDGILNWSSKKYMLMIKMITCGKEQQNAAIQEAASIALIKNVFFFFQRFFLIRIIITIIFMIHHNDHDHDHTTDSSKLAWSLLAFPWLKADHNHDN